MQRLPLIIPEIIIHDRRYRITDDTPPQLVALPATSKVGVIGNSHSSVPQRTPKCKNACLAKKLAKGAFAFGKLVIGIDDVASDADIIKRQQMCEGCAKQDFGICSEDRGGCGCILWAKIRIKGEECPDKHW